NERAALADTVRLPLRLDALALQLVERVGEVVDAHSDVSVAGAEVVRAAVVVQGQLELLLLAGHAEEVVRRLALAAADDVHVAAELEPQRLVERPAALGIGDAVHGVQVFGHAASLWQRSWLGPRSAAGARREGELHPRLPVRLVDVDLFVGAV